MMKTLIKKTFKLTFRLLLLPIYLWFELLARLANEDSVFQSFSQYLSLIPGKLGSYCRAAFYWWTCPNTSDEISIGFLTVFSHRDTTIDPGVYIGPQCNIGKCHIGANTLLGSGVHILSGNRQHHFEDATKPIQKQGGTFKKITIGSDCWIGNSAIVLQDIPDHCVLSAGAVVNKIFNEGDIIIGTSGKKLKNRTELEQELSQNE